MCVLCVWLGLVELETHEERRCFFTCGAIHNARCLRGLFRITGRSLVIVTLADRACDAFHPNAIRASLGTVFSTSWAVGSSHEVRDFLSDNQIRIATAKVDANNSYFDLDMTGKTAIVLGSEHDGLSSAWNGQEVNDVSIPMVGCVDSLNISVSAAILLYEARRQRSTTK